MNKKDLVEVVRGLELGLKKAEAEEVVASIFDAMAGTLAKGEDVEVYGFGKFKIKDVAERTGRNPQTGEALTVPAHKKVAFAASKNLKDAVK